MLSKDRGIEEKNVLDETIDEMFKIGLALLATAAHAVYRDKNPSIESKQKTALTKCPERPKAKKTPPGCETS